MPLGKLHNQGLEHLVDCFTYEELDGHMVDDRHLGFDEGAIEHIMECKDSYEIGEDGILHWVDTKLELDMSRRPQLDGWVRMMSN